MANSGLDPLDYCAVALDEISLEGLDGITLPTLWIRLSSQPQFLLKIDEASKNFIWKVIRSHPQIEFYQLPSDRPDFVPFNRFEHLDQDYGIVVEPSTLPEDPYPFAAVDDKKNGVRGSCTTYKERVRVTDQLPQLSLAEAEQRFGRRRLVAVASQGLRNAALVPIHSMEVETELNLSQFLLLERIGRSRFHGEVTVGVQGLGVLKEPPKNLYYLRKKLLEYRLITKQGFCMRGNNGKNCQGRLYHIPRFFREFRPKYQVIIEQAAELLQKQPNYTMLISEFNKHFDNSSSLKKVAKMSEFQRFIKWEMVPHRTMFPDAPRSEWLVKNSGNERSCRIYRLLDPDVCVRTALEEVDEGEADPDGDAILKFPDQSTMNLLHSLERQAFNLLHVHGARGLDSNNLRKELGQTPLDARALLKSLANITQAVETFREDVGRTRITKYVASRYVHMSENRLEFSQEEKRLKSLAVKPGSASEQEQQLPSLSPAEPVFVMPCAPEEKSGPPVLMPAEQPAKPKADGATATGPAPDPLEQTATPAAGTEQAGFENLTDMENCFLELIDPVCLEPISARQEVIPLEKTELFSKSSSSRLVKRTRIILEIVQKLKIIDNAFQLRRMVQNSEDDQGIMTKMDRKSFNRILKRLADAGLIKNFRLTLTRDGQTRQRHIIADESVTKDNTLLKSALEQARAAFLVQMGVMSALQTELEPTDSLAPDVASSVKEYHRRFRSVMGGDSAGGRPHVTATKRSQNETYFMPKFRRLQLLQEVLFYISREYAGDPTLDQTEPRRRIAELDPALHLDLLPRVYTTGEDFPWQMFVSPLPTHASWGHGWSLLCDVLIRMPLCIFLRLINIQYYTPAVHSYMKHKVLRNLPPTHLPEDVISCLFWQRKYMFSIHDDITRLVFMGLAQFGQQMLAKDQVFVYCNRNASLLDTSISREGYHKVDPDIQYPVKMYHFDSMASLWDYWFDLKTIALSTPLGSRNLVAGQKITIEIPFYKSALVSWATARNPEEAASRDLGQIPGDHLGAGGIDSSLFAHVLRNWKWRRANAVASKMVEDSFDGPRPKRRRLLSGRQRPTAKLEPAAQQIGPVVDVHIHKSAGAGGDLPILVTRGRNVRRTTAGQKRAAPDDAEAGPSKKRQATDGGAGSTSTVGLTQRRLRVSRHKCRTKLERVMRGRKRRGPKPPRDDVDKRALQLLKKQRCDWSDQENTYLLLARVALGLLSDTYKVPSRQYMTVRDALHETIEESRNKTALAVHRRIGFMLRRSQTAADVSLTIQEQLMDPEIRRIIGTPRLTQNEYTTEVVFPQRFRQLMAVLMANWDKSSTKGNLLPEDYSELKRQYDIVLGDQVRLGLTVSPPECRSEADVHLFTAMGLVVSHLASREDKSSPMAQLYHASQLFPEELMLSAISYLRSAGVASQRRGSAGQKVIKEAKGLLHATSRPYTLSTKFRHRFIQRYQYGVYAECFAFFKTLLWNSLRERAATAVGGVQRGGQAAMIFSLMADNKLQYQVAVPDNLIKLSRQEEEQGNALMQSMIEYRADGDDQMALGRSSGGTKRVGVRSLSRLVLLATRESQDAELLTVSAGGRPVRKDTHNYHEQLHIVPFTVLARLAVPDEAAAEPEQDESMEVDERHMPVSPLVIQTARDRHARMLSRTAPAAAGVLETLQAEGAVSPEDVSNIKRLLTLLEDAGVLGLEPAQLMTESGLARSQLRRLAALMERHELLLRCGVSRLLYVARSVGQPWVLHSYHLTRLQQETVASGVAAAGGDFRTASERSLQSVFFQPTPWRRISGTVNRRVLDRLAGAVLSHCMTLPGVTLSDVQQFFHPMLTAHQTRLLVETLAEIGCVRLAETRQVSRTTLFSKRTDLVWYEGEADDFSPADSVVVVPAADAVLRFACFVGDKPYGQEFLEPVGM